MAQLALGRRVYRIESGYNDSHSNLVWTDKTYNRMSTYGEYVFARIKLRQESIISASKNECVATFFCRCSEVGYNCFSP